MSSFKVPTALLPLVKEKLKRANRRAKKLGFNPIVIETGEPFLMQTHHLDKLAFLDNYGEYKTSMVEVKVHGEAPVIAGYKLLAVVDCRGETPVIKTVPGAEEVDLSDWYADVDAARCDHCHKARRRNDVLILQDEKSGDLLQIGRNCAADFFRSKDAASMIKVMNSILSAGEFEDDDYNHVDTGETYVPILRVLELASAIIRKTGYVKSDEAGTPTKFVVLENIWRQHKDLTVEEIDRQKAVEVRDWLVENFVNKDPAKRSNFEHNVAASIEDGKVRTRNLGFIIWAVPGYERAKAKEAAKKASDYVGTVGKRETFTATLVSVRYFENIWGVRTLVTFKTKDDNVIVWWASNDPQLEENVEYTFKATVKAHKPYDGVPQTIVNRVALV